MRCLLGSGFDSYALVYLAIGLRRHRYLCFETCFCVVTIHLVTNAFRASFALSRLQPTIV